MMTLEIPRWLFWLIILFGPALMASIGWGICACMTLGKLADLEMDVSASYRHGFDTGYRSGQLKAAESLAPLLEESE